MIMKMGITMTCVGALLLMSACGMTSKAQDPPAENIPANGKHAHNSRRLFQLDTLQLVKIKIDKHTFFCWVMDTTPKRSEGMMFLQNKDFKDNDSMIFVFDRAQELGFWMQNTLVDLDIAYCDPNGRIIRAVTMKALDETSVPSRGLAKYAIEFRAGTFKKLGIRPGMKVEIPSTVQAKE
ncbi:MAG: DUF192 domain-containing protein [Chthonomonas sp.]|nr:DUF192 domain-containing protein [Chthonomonas sp.]